MPNWIAEKYNGSRNVAEYRGNRKDLHLIWFGYEMLPNGEYGKEISIYFDDNGCYWHSID